MGLLNAFLRAGSVAAVVGLEIAVIISSAVVCCIAVLCCAANLCGGSVASILVSSCFCAGLSELVSGVAAVYSCTESLSSLVDLVLRSLVLCENFHCTNI